MKVLPADFFNSPAPVVAPRLLGQYLIRRLNDGRQFKAQITEVEAYEGSQDKASHASRGKTTANQVMFGPAGRWYIYLVYGLHHMVNIVTGPADYPAAVLIRSVAGLSGPGRLTRHWQIDRQLTNQPALPKTGLFIVAGPPITTDNIMAGPRIGVDYAGKFWRQKPYRFYLKNLLK